MIPLREAQAFVLAACPRGGPRSIPIDRALGCVASVAVVATEPVPPFVNSSRDGYALRSADTGAAADGTGAVRLDVVGSIMAGATLGRGIGEREAARIMTGAPLPSGADAVCQLEDCEVTPDGATVVIDRPVTTGTAVRMVGEDVRMGETVVEADSVLTPGALGVLANQGITEVSVYPPLRVGVLSTGDELVPGPEPLAPGQIRDANRHALLALVRREGWIAVDLGIVRDDEEALVDALHRAADRCDVVVTSGGVSVGDLDIVKVVLKQESGGSMRWMQVAIRPAKPFAFGTLSGSALPVFGLPGNPVSAMVSFELFVRPAGRQMSGHHSIERPVVPAVASDGFLRDPDGKTHFLRSVVSLDAHGVWRVRPVAGQESHQLSALSRSNSLAVLPDGTGVSVGGPVDVMLTDPERVEMATPAGDRPW